MIEQPEQTTMYDPQLRRTLMQAATSLNRAIEAPGIDMQLQRALIHAAGALDRRLGRGVALPNRVMRRQKRGP